MKLKWIALIACALYFSACEEHLTATSTSSVTVAPSQAGGMRWRGILTEEPSEDNQAGDIYYNPDDESAYLYTGEAWVAL